MDISAGTVLFLSWLVWFLMVALYVVSVICYRFVTDGPMKDRINFYFFKAGKRNIDGICMSLFLSLFGIGGLGGFVFGLLISLLVFATAVPATIAAIAITLYTARGIVRLRKALAEHKADKDAHK